MECLVNYSIKNSNISEKFVKSVVTEVLGGFPKYKGCGLSVNLVGETKIKTLNNLYRHKNKVTDVLAFSLNDIKTQGDYAQDLGDVFICLPQIKKQAQELKISFKEEFTRILVHGVLHLLGFDHVEKKAEQKMFLVQEKIVSKIL